MTVVAILFATIVIGAMLSSSDQVAGVAPSISVPNTAVPNTAVPSVWPTTEPAFPPEPPVAKVSYLAKSVPVRLQIGAIGVDSTLMDLGLQKDGTMEVPPSGFPAGWYTGAPTPGEMGPAIIAGHIDWNGPGVFLNLHQLKVGDRITVTRKDGSQPVFRVTLVEKYLKDEFPTTLVYGNLDHAALRLITCGGSFNNQTGHYEDNIVAFADLVAPAR